MRLGIQIIYCEIRWIKTIDDMKNMLQEQAKNNDKILKDEVNQAYTYLKQSKVSNKDDVQK